MGPFFGLGPGPKVCGGWECGTHVPVCVTENGIEVLGNERWSALDNYEWAGSFRPTFELIAVDREP